MTKTQGKIRSKTPNGKTRLDEHERVIGTIIMALESRDAAKEEELKDIKRRLEALENPPSKPRSSMGKIIDYLRGVKA